MIQKIVQECIEEEFLEKIYFFEKQTFEKSLSERFKILYENTINDTMKIINSTLEDKAEIFRLYELASEYMKSKNQVFYPKFPVSLVEEEIKENCQWKLILEDKIACIWATTFEDPNIWEEKNEEPSVYIHRIVTSPDFRGKNLVKHLVHWAKTFAKKHHKNYLRLDTVGHNKALIKHYTKLGFNFLGMKKLKTTEGLPDHYKQDDVCLFELSIG